MNERTIPLILGSQSPRRCEILQAFGIPFQTCTPPFDEDVVPFEGDPVHYAQFLAREKGESLRKTYPNSYLLTADTVVYCEGKSLGKPSSPQQTIQQLHALSGRWHEVVTALSLIGPGINFLASDSTRVLFHSLSEDQIRKYATQLPCQDKAGGYMIQGAGSLIVRKIDGCYYNVLGLPLTPLYAAFSQIGIDLWDHLKSRQSTSSCLIP